MICAQSQSVRHCLRWIQHLAILLLCSALPACEDSAARAPWQQQIYVWQRVWNAQHVAALRASAADFTVLRVLAGQLHPQAGWTPARADLALLHQDGRRVVAVIRLDGQLPQLDAGTISAHVAHIVQQWRAAGVRLQGVEIDHDCGTAHLRAYAALLQQLRDRLPRELQLSITALPSWLQDSESLTLVLSRVDSSVLQVHAVSKATAGLMDPTQALRWIESYARAQRPFFVALPAYGMALVMQAGEVRIESEVSLGGGDMRRELSVDPQQLAGFLTTLRRRNVSGLAGIVWFRLPLAADQRAWPMSTLLAVVRGTALESRLRLEVTREGALYDLRLANSGTLGADLPQLIVTPARDCTAADGVGRYTVERTATALVFRRRQQTPSGSPLQLAAGQERPLGWARCRSLDAAGLRIER